MNFESRRSLVDDVAITKTVLFCWEKNHRTNYEIKALEFYWETYFFWGGGVQNSSPGKKMTRRCLHGQKRQKNVLGNPKNRSMGHGKASGIEQKAVARAYGAVLKSLSSVRDDIEFFFVCRKKLFCFFS